MRNVKVVRHKQRLDTLFAKVKTLEPDNEMTPYLSRYLCVLVSGFIEESMRSLLSDHALSCAPPHVGNFVLQKMRRFTNCKTEKILGVLEQFKPKWRESLTEGFDSEMKDAIDSVIAIRHEIAHGKDSGISFATISRYYKSVIKAISLIEATLDQ